MDKCIEQLGYVFDALFTTRYRINGVVPLIGFSGGIWTLFCYMVEGGGSKNYSKVKKFIHTYPDETKALFKKMSKIISAYFI